MAKTLPSSAGVEVPVPGQEARIPRALRPEKPQTNIKQQQKQYCNKFNKDFEMVHIREKNLIKKIVKVTTISKTRL